MVRATLKDIAKILNVSKVTVSKALRDFPDISLEMKKRAKQVAEELGYTPNYIARNLSIKKTYTIGVVVPDIANLFFATAIHGIINSASEKDYQIILTVSMENDEIEKKNIKKLLSMRCDGLIISISQNTSDLEIFKAIRKLEIPVVFFDRVLDGLGFSSVVSNDRAGAIIAVEYLIKSGYTKIAHLAGSSKTEIGKERCIGYKIALQKHGIPIRKEWIIEGGFNKKDGYEGFKKLYENNKLPEVIFTANGLIAAGIYTGIKEVGMSIPEDISVMGFGYNEFTNFLSPPLTIMCEKPGILGSKAMDLLAEELENPDISKPRRIVVPLELEVHKSC